MSWKYQATADNDWKYEATTSNDWKYEAEALNQELLLNEDGNPVLNEDGTLIILE